MVTITALDVAQRLIDLLGPLDPQRLQTLLLLAFLEHTKRHRRGMFPEHFLMVDRRPLLCPHGNNWNNLPRVHKAGLADKMGPNHRQTIADVVRDHGMASDDELLECLNEHPMIRFIKASGIKRVDSALVLDWYYRPKPTQNDVDPLNLYQAPLYLAFIVGGLCAVLGGSPLLTWGLTMAGFTLGTLIVMVIL